MKPRGLAFKLSLLILAGGLAVLASIFAYNYEFVRRILEDRAEENALNLTRATVFRVESVLAAAQKVPANLAATLEYTHYDEEELLELLRLAVESNREVQAAGIAFAPGGFDPHRPHFAPYAFRERGDVKIIYRGGPHQRYELDDWYQIPRETEEAAWSEPYYAVGGAGMLMSTYSVPFYRGEGEERRFRGVVTADVSLDWLESLLASVRLLDTGHAFLLSRNGVVVTHPRRDLIMNESIFSLAEERRDPGLRAIGRDMIAAGTGFVPTSCIGRDEGCWLAYAPIPANGWSLGALLPQAEMMADVDRLNRTAAAVAAGGALLLLFFVVAAARSVTRPIVALAEASDAIARGNLDGPLPPVRSRDEVGRLTSAFHGMQGELRRSIAALEEANRTLEQRVQERTLELRDKNAALEETLARLEQTQEQLIVQEKLASLGALTAGIAHEIKNPLNFVNNFAELSVELADELEQGLAAERDKLAAAAAEDLDAIVADLRTNVAKIREHGKRADRIVAGMLEHSRGSSGERRPVDLNALLDEDVALAYHGMRARDASFNAAIDKQYDPALPAVAAVAEDLGRVFLNIAGNAFWAVREKARTAGPGYAPAVVVRTADLGDRVEIRIRDNGPGMPAEVREKVFNPFFTTKPAGEGTGLGLSISYDVVVRQHGGELRVESEEGEWTEFIVTLRKEG